MHIRQLEYFIAVAETLNFTKASQRFFISQTAVTQQIKALEKEMNVMLFLRNKRHVELTPAGKAFLTDAKEVVRHLTIAIAKSTSVSTGFIGTLKIGIVKDYMDVDLVDYIKLFYKEYPNISFIFVRNNVGYLYDSLLNGNLDIVFNVKFNLEKYSQIQYRTFKKAPLLAILPPSHPLAHKISLTRSDLKEEAFILIGTEENNFGEKDSILKGFLESGYLPNNRQYVEDVETILIMVASNMGIALVPSYALPLQNFAGRIISVPILGDEERVEIISAWDKSNNNPSLTKFLANL